MSTQFINQNGIRYAYDDSMHRLVTPDDDQFFQQGDWIGVNVPGEGGFFQRIFDYEIGSRIPAGAIVIRVVDRPKAPSLTRATALFWIAMGFLLWAVVSAVIDWTMGG